MGFWCLSLDFKCYTESESLPWDRFGLGWDFASLSWHGLASRSFQSWYSLCMDLASLHKVRWAFGTIGMLLTPQFLSSLWPPLWVAYLSSSLGCLIGVSNLLSGKQKPWPQIYLFPSIPHSSRVDYYYSLRSHSWFPSFFTPYHLIHQPILLVLPLKYFLSLSIFSLSCSLLHFYQIENYATLTSRPFR